ncbi:hypothetical protein F5Y10DRAFT_263057 [Nemania abortiva]|nr:hypothetical protein F5Y10DRAFT_263057 [Nemania abortiva]
MLGASNASHSREPVPLSQTPAFDPPDSNPDDIAILWEQVCPQRGRANKRVGEADSTVSSITNLLAFSKPNIAPGSSVSSTDPVTSTNLATITTGHPDFYNIVLNKCGIYIHKKIPIVPSAFVHFDTKKPQEGYSSLQGLANANVWVEKDSVDLKRIAVEYNQMKGLGLSEEEFATFAKEIFLLGPWRSDGVALDGQWRADRMVRLVCPPDEEKDWLAPPLLDGHGAGDIRWSWDVRPDCAYWLSLKGFDPEYGFHVQDCTFVREYITCPYFTIEFTKDGQSENVALNQVAAAGSLALFNRWRLYSDARKADPTLAEDISNIRHYTLTFVGSLFVFWVLQPTIRDGQWNGCTMTRLVRANCIDEYGVRTLIDWIHEVHLWGLSVHGPRCERDLKSILQAGGVRISNIHEDFV